MFTFLFIANVPNDQPQSFLRSCASLVKDKMPSLGTEIEERYAVIPEVRGGWFSLQPTASAKYPPLSQVVTEQYAVITFGHLWGHDDSPASQVILETWISKGAEGVRALEGCFSTVLVDRIHRKTVLLSDELGQRTLRYFTSGEMLIVSPHDVPLVATGYVPLDFDYTSVTGTVVHRWTLRDRSFLKHIETCHPVEYVEWTEGKAKKIFSPTVMRPEERIHIRDRKGIANNMDRILEAAQAHLEPLAHEPIVGHSLTAGVDSRAILSLLFSVVSPSQIRLYTRGGKRSQDVRVAQKIAMKLGLEHSVTSPSPPQSTDFLAHCDLLAFFLNGSSDSMLAIRRPVPDFEPDFTPELGGKAGELFRGYYYPYYAAALKRPMSSHKALRFLKHKLLNKPNLPWTSPVFMDDLEERFDAGMAEYATISSNGYDLLDLFSLYEGTSVLYRQKSMALWKPTPNWTPFYSRKVTNLAFRMPAPIGNYARLHQEAVRRFTPEIFWIPINGKSLLAFPQAGVLSPSLIKFLRERQRFLRKMLSAVKLGSKSKSGQSMMRFQEEVVRNSFTDVLRDLFLDPGSFAMELFGKSGVEALLSESQLGSSLGSLGYLITIERWRKLIEETHREASQVAILSSRE